MKVSISLPDDDIRFLDAYAETEGLGSRSAALRKAVRLLRASELGPAYEEAFAGWADSEDAALWEGTVVDGMGSDEER
jgi:Arc/MetJ-type ribon-helix-helix transcriptional regulator